jgi:hypothetical protein
VLNALQPTYNGPVKWIAPRLAIIVLGIAVVVIAGTVVNRFGLTGWPKYLVMGVGGWIAATLVLAIGKRVDSRARP